MEVLPPEMLPEDEGSAAKRFWAAQAIDFYKLCQPWSVVVAERVLAFRPATVFEFGCCAGKNLRAILERASDVLVYGIDINHTAIEYARAQGLRCGVGDETTLFTFPDKSFDVAFTISVLDHLPDPAVALGELTRIARRAVLLHEPWIGKEGKILKVPDPTSGEGTDATPFTYSWDYEKLTATVAPFWKINTNPLPIETRLGRHYHLFTLIRLE